MLLHTECPDALDVRSAWRLWLRAASMDGDLDARTGPVFSNAFLAIDAAVAGMGMALVPRMLADHERRTKRLAAPFATILDDEARFRLVWRKGSDRRPAIAAFRAWVGLRL